MKANKVIAVIVIVIGLSGSAYMLYLTFSTVGTPNNRPVFVDPNPSAVLVTGSGQPGAILPFGTNLDTSGIKKYNGTQKLFPYPSVSTSEIGRGNNIIY